MTIEQIINYSTIASNIVGVSGGLYAFYHFLKKAESLQCVNQILKKSEDGSFIHLFLKKYRMFIFIKMNIKKSLFSFN